MDADGLTFACAMSVEEMNKTVRTAQTAAMRVSENRNRASPRCNRGRWSGARNSSLMLRARFLLAEQLAQRVRWFPKDS